MKYVSFFVHLSYKQLKTEVCKENNGKPAFILFALLKHSKN